MAKITRPRLARGTKLLKQHVENSVGSVATSLSSANAERVNMACQYVPRRLHFHVPLLDSSFFASSTNGRTLFGLPFTLPPFQSDWSALGQITTSNPSGAILSSFQLSFDQAGEPCSLADRTQVGALMPGCRNENGTGGYAMTISLDEKRQLYFDSAAGNVCDTNVFQAKLAAEAVSGRDFRANPFYIGDLNKQLRHYRTYMLTLDANALYNAVTGNKSALVSLDITLELLVPLVVRDGPNINGQVVQNLPSPWLNDKLPKPVAQTAIAADSIITEVKTQGNIAAVDQAFVAGLEGGNTQESIPPPLESIRDDSAWHCVVVPLFANLGPTNVVNADVAGLLPYVGIAPFQTATVDRRRFPIVYPWTLHHAILCENVMAPPMALAASRPFSVNLRKDVGVGVSQGRRGDDFAYQQIARLLFNPGAAGYLDEVAVCQNAQVMPWRLWPVPLTGVGGAGYAAQGKPIFVGKTTYPASSRTNIAGGAPVTLGRETDIEVRMSIYNTVDGLADVGDGGVEDPNAVYVGTGGNFLLLFGKSPLVGNLQDVQV